MSANANSRLLGGGGGGGSGAGSWLITSTQRCTQGETAFYMFSGAQTQADRPSHLARTVATAEHQIWRNQMHHLNCE